MIDDLEKLSPEAAKKVRGIVETRLTDAGYYRIWDSETIQLDGDFTPDQLRAFIAIAEIIRADKL